MVWLAEPLQGFRQESGPVTCSEVQGWGGSRGVTRAGPEEQLPQALCQGGACLLLRLCHHYEEALVASDPLIKVASTEEEMGSTKPLASPPPRRAQGKPPSRGVSTGEGMGAKLPQRGLPLPERTWKWHHAVTAPGTGTKCYASVQKYGVAQWCLTTRHSKGYASTCAITCAVIAASSSLSLHVRLFSLQQDREGSASPTFPASLDLVETHSWSGFLASLLNSQLKA